MEFSELIRIRKSCRSYSEAKVNEEDVKEMILAAQQAPSWKNTQTGRYYVALSDEGIENVFNTLPEYNQRSSKNAAYIVTTFVSGLSGVASDGTMAKAGDIWGGYDLGLQNAYMLLRAAELGYDTLVMGLRDEDALRTYFAIPENEIIMAVIAVGKRNGDTGMRPRKGLDEIMKIR
ncbi:MAG: nitroreductase family protein [Erysipelotrichaceae bacterium]|nr:nitroreductase family protein [Erysipelotrichaceae bacterium]